MQYNGKEKTEDFSLIYNDHGVRNLRRDLLHKGRQKFTVTIFDFSNLSALLWGTFKIEDNFLKK
jgi:hypothetical protein